MKSGSQSTPYATQDGRPVWTASMLIPGWGQLCQVRPVAVFWFVVVLVLYIANWRWGLLAHNLCVLDAWVFAARTRKAA